MKMTIADLQAPAAAADNIEIVERKGLGHPDTLCDILAERLSMALCRFYLERFGLILHHNVDKALLWGGIARARFGGGEVIEPAELFLAGRATLGVDEVKVPVAELAQETCREWLRDHFHALDPERHIRIRCLIHPGSADLVELYTRQLRSGVWLANDTSCGVGYAPLSELERMVLAIEHALNNSATRLAYPAIGQDVKVMGIREGERFAFTVGCALIDRYIADRDAYLTTRMQVADMATTAARQIVPGRDITVTVNAADDIDSDSLFLTVTGTSAEAGDDGQAGRGNRANGLITPYRPMTMESTAGKNPLTHVGKLYNVIAGAIAARLVSELSDIAEAQCMLVSQIGKPVAEPQCINVKVRTRDARPAALLADAIGEIADSELAASDQLWRRALEGSLALY
jgi:S-adenosylmethionine synthetase